MAFRIACGFMIGIFLISCIVQYNDPDPGIWLIAYGLAAVATALPLAGRHTLLPLVLGLAYFGWAMFNMPHVAPGTWLQNEEARESGGLMVCAIWMAILTAAWYRHRHPATN